MPDSTKQTVVSPLYIAGQSFGLDRMIQHCLWKILSEAGLIYNPDLTERESAVLARLLNKRNAGTAPLTSDQECEMAVLNCAIDKIVCQVKALQIDKQKHHLALEENRRLKNGGTVPKFSQLNSALPSIETNRSIDDVGLSKRAARILQTMGIDTLEKLRSCSLSRLRNQDRIGVKTIHDIQFILAKYTAHPSPDR